MTGQFARHSALLPPHFYLLNDIKLVRTREAAWQEQGVGPGHVVCVASQQCDALPAPSGGCQRACQRCSSTYAPTTLPQVLHLRDEGFASLVEFCQGSCHGVITFGNTAAFPPTTKVCNSLPAGGAAAAASVGQQR